MSEPWRGSAEAAYTRAQVMSVSDKPRLADLQPFFVMGCPG